MMVVWMGRRWVQLMAAKMAENMAKLLVADKAVLKVAVRALKEEGP